MSLYLVRRTYYVRLDSTSRREAKEGNPRTRKERWESRFALKFKRHYHGHNSGERQHQPAIARFRFLSMSHTHQSSFPDSPYHSTYRVRWTSLTRKTTTRQRELCSCWLTPQECHRLRCCQCWCRHQIIVSIRRRLCWCQPWSIHPRRSFRRR
jgi:hypothetical protein